MIEFRCYFGNEVTTNNIVNNINNINNKNNINNSNINNWWFKVVCQESKGFRVTCSDSTNFQ